MKILLLEQVTRGRSLAFRVGDYVTASHCHGEITVTGKIRLIFPMAGRLFVGIRNEQDGWIHYTATTNVRRVE